MTKPPSARALQLHRQACERGQAGYMDPESGLFVLSSHYLKAQGSCCGSGCRHCPWDAQEQRMAGREPGQPCWPYPAPDKP